MGGALFRAEFELLRDARHVLRGAHCYPDRAARYTGHRAPARANREHLSDEIPGDREGFAPFMVGPGRDHFEDPPSLRCAFSHHVAGVLSTRTGRAQDFELSVADPHVHEEGQSTVTLLRLCEGAPKRLGSLHDAVGVRTGVPERRDRANPLDRP